MHIVAFGAEDGVWLRRYQLRDHEFWDLHLFVLDFIPDLCTVIWVHARLNDLVDESGSSWMYNKSPGAV